ncbi:hypothetical protein [Tsuneonella amylolytica]|uniref:hypothetical protein n=1 Tax=Tsuneonella amylolytica TaxID=2338327 RepID=UPI000EA8FBDA|nr:hypothetical protein [Tsuneonella amylolytica]
MASRPPEHSTEGRMEPTPPTNQERVRFAFISIHRLVGAALIVLGILVLQGGIDWSQKVGWVLLVVGLLDFFIAPLAFARLWRTRPE